MYDKKFWEELIAYFSLIRHGPHRKRRFQKFFCCCLCIRSRSNVFPRRYLATIAGYTYVYGQDYGRDLRSTAFEMGSGAMIYIQSFIKTGLAIQKLMWGIHRQHGDLMSLPLLFQNMESRLKMWLYFAVTSYSR
jgi:hypothetical protein